MNATFSKATNLAYFKKDGKLCAAKFDLDTLTIDFSSAYRVNYYSLTDEEMIDAFNALSVLEEDE